MLHILLTIQRYTALKQNGVLAMESLKYLQDLLLYYALQLWFKLNFLLIVIEDFVYPFSSIEVVAPVFICGHQRSGTTNLHHSLYDSEWVSSFTMVELLLPSYILKAVLLYPLRCLASICFARFDSTAHAVDVDELAE